MGLFGLLFDVEFIGSDGAIVWMMDQFEFHGCVALGAEKRVAAKAFKKELFKGSSGKDAEAIGADGYFGGKYSGKFLPDFLIANMAMESVVANALEAFGEDVLNHAPDKAEGGTFSFSTKATNPFGDFFHARSTSCSMRWQGMFSNGMPCRIVPIVFLSQPIYWRAFRYCKRTLPGIYTRIPFTTMKSIRSIVWRFGEISLHCWMPRV